jgi:mannose-6-phosphate isomerase
MIKTPDVLIFKPIFKERIWGGQSLKDFGFEIPEGSIGECWGISGHPHGMTEVSEGPYKGRNLLELYTHYPQWFNDENKKQFPLLLKILDCKEDLSVQVHPNDNYALQHEGDQGKHEAWIVLKAQKHTRLQLGHHVTTKEALFQSIEANSWGTLLHYYPSIHQYDYIDIPPGTLHALCSGSLILEIQQSSDITYRVYDYNRLEKNNQKRELHIEKALEVIKVPDNEHKIKSLNFNQINNLISFLDNEKFSLYYLNKVENYPYILNRSKYLCGFLLEGTLNIFGKLITKNTFFIIPSDDQPILLQGEFKAILTKTNN